MLERGKSTWLIDGWIGANRPKSAGRGECVTSTDGVAMAWDQQMSWIQKERDRELLWM